MRIASRTPLHHVALHGQTSIAKGLLKSGALIEAMDKDKNTNTPLHLAVWKSHTGVVQLLLVAFSKRLELL